MRKMILPLVSILFIILISCFPVQSLDGAQYGLSAFLGAVLPALLPFFVATTILVRSGACAWLARLFRPVMRLFRLPGDVAVAFVVSCLSGYPAGAKTVCELHNAGRLSDSEARVSYVLCSTTGPAFILGTIGTMIQTPCWLYLLVPHYISAIAAGLCARFYTVPQPLHHRGHAASKQEHTSAASMLVDVIGSTASGLWRVGSFIMFFSSVTFILADIGALDFIGSALGWPLRLLGLDPNMGGVLASGMLEMTAGSISAAYSEASIGSILPLVSFILSFGGVSILMQTFTFAGQTVRFGYLTVFKLVQGIISMLVTSLFILIFPLDIATFSMTQPAMQQLSVSLPALLLVAAFPLAIAVYKMIRHKGYRRVQP